MDVRRIAVSWILRSKGLLDLKIRVRRSRRGTSGLLAERIIARCGQSMTNTASGHAQRLAEVV